MEKKIQFAPKSAVGLAQKKGFRAEPPDNPDYNSRACLNLRAKMAASKAPLYDKGFSVASKTAKLR